MKKNFFTIIMCLLLFAGCDIINPEEEIPAYLHVKKFEVDATPGQGSNSNSITEAFVFVDNSFLGAYSLPATIPVLGSGEQKIDLFPGIKDNGIDATPEIYPFYSFVSENRTLTDMEVDTVSPRVEYLDNAKFGFIESFESSLQIFRDDIDEDSLTFVNLTTTDVFEGSKSGAIVLSRDNPVLQVASIRLSELPAANRETYLELNYKTEVPFEIGVFYYDETNFPFSDFRHGVNTKAEWTKIYINLTPEFNGLNGLPGLKDFQIGIRSLMERDDSGGYVDGTRTIWIDNVKLVYF